MGEIVSLKRLVSICKKLKKQGKKIVFTNGCFDLLHIGHIHSLKQSKKLGDILVVGLNSDSSVRELKGQKRPLISEKERAMILANLVPVDYVCIFSDRTPYDLISKIQPDILAKGADYNIDEIVGADIVNRNRGKVRRIKLIKGKSTKDLIRSIVRKFGSN